MDAKRVNAALWLLEDSDLHEQRSEQIAGFVESRRELDEAWQERTKRILSWGNAYQSTAMGKVYLGLIKSGAYEEDVDTTRQSDFWVSQAKHSAENPSFFWDVVSEWFTQAVERYDDGVTWNFLDPSPVNKSDDGARQIAEIAQADPQLYVNRMLPIVIATIARTKDKFRNRTWPSLSNHTEAFDVDDAILLAMKHALKFLAIQHPDEFRHHEEVLRPVQDLVASYLLLSGWIANPTEFANECVDYLVAAAEHLDIGYDSWSGSAEGTGESAVTRSAIVAVSPICDADRYASLESLIVGYSDAVAAYRPQWRGSDELLLLRSLNKERRSEKVVLRIEELERKFPDLEDDIIPDDDSGAQVGGRLPIPDSAMDKMTDEQWIKAMQKYDNPSDWFGDTRELADSVRSRARRDRVRFAKLCEKMPDDTSTIYFNAILNGMIAQFMNLSKEEREADQQQQSAIETEVYVSVIYRLHRLPNRPCGRAIMTAIESLAKRDLSESVFDVVDYYATEETDQSSTISESGDYVNHGINEVRGYAAETIQALLFAKEERLPRLRPAITHLAYDEVLAVRACAIEALTPMLNFARDEAVTILLRLCDGHIGLCGTHGFDRFIHYAILTHFDELDPLLRLSLQSENEKAKKCASQRIILAELSGVDVGDLGSLIRSGDAVMRSAAAAVMARNISDGTIGDRCAAEIVSFLNDEDEGVRTRAGSAFQSLSDNRMLELEKTIAEFVESDSFEQGSDRFLYALEKSKCQLPEVVCRSAERMLELSLAAKDEGRPVRTLASHVIAGLVVRQYEQAAGKEELRVRCLDLIDQIEELGFADMTSELEKLDRS